ncbi:MAG: hypothetical protein AB8B55_07605 [Mariniblastus sp.]
MNNFSTTAMPTEQSSPSAGKYQVEISSGFSKPQVFQGELTGPITVQDALEASGAIEKNRGMDVVVMRVVQDSGRGLRMPVDYEYRTKTVSQEQNYALHPNDRILVTARSSNPLDKFVKAISPGQSSF